MPTSLTAPKLLFIDFDLRKDKLPFNVKVVCTDPSRLEAIRAEETAAVERRVALLVAAGAKAVLSARAMDDFALKAFARAGVVALKNVPRPELKRAAKATGGRVLTSLAAMDGKDCDERVPSDALGTAELLRERRVGDAALLVEIIRKKGGAARGAATLLLRGPNEAALDEAERAVHDVLCALKRVLESRRVVVGGGVVETALSVYLENLAETIVF